MPEVVRGYVRDVRVRWACEEAGLAYAENLVDVRAKPADFAQVQPWKQVPALQDGDVHLFESGAILIHLAEARPALAWTIAALNTLEPVVMDLVNAAFFAAGKEWSRLRLPEIHEFLQQRLSPVATRLADRDWLAGDFSIADILMVHILQNVRDFDDALAPHPRLVAYVERGLARPACTRALADHLAAFDRWAANGKD